MTARADTVQVDSLVERCGANLDSTGARYPEGLLQLTFAPSSPERVPLTTHASLVFWDDARSPLTFPSGVRGTATVLDPQGRLHVADLARATIERRSPTRLRWSARFASDTAEVTADGEDEFAFKDSTATEPSDQPPRQDAGVALLDAGTPCSSEFGVAATLPQVARPPSLGFLSRERAADPLCGGALAWVGLVDVSASSLGAVTQVQFALPAGAAQVATFVADSQQVTFLACAPVAVSRLFVRLSDGASAADLCGPVFSGAATPCPFSTSLPAPSANFSPPFTRTSTPTVALCSGGVRVSYTFDTDVRVSGYAVEQPYARTQQNPRAVSSPGWRFNTCLSIPGVSVYAVQLTTATGLFSPPVCISD
jgi:hypothetical protein